MRFNLQSLQVKLSSFIFILGLVITLMLAILSFQMGQQFLRQSAVHNLESLRDTRLYDLKNFFELQEDILSTFANTPLTREALEAYEIAYAEGINSSHYDSINQKYDPFFSGIRRGFGLYDVFLVDRSGEIIYSVIHEADFATSLQIGPYKDENIATAFRYGLERPVFVDFEPYKPSNDEPASFLAHPVRNSKGESLGVFIIQVPSDRFNEVATSGIGLGETGQSYLVGEDVMLRTNLRLIDEEVQLKVKVRNESVTKAFRKESGSTTYKDASGKLLISSYAYFEVMGTSYAFICEIEEAEVMAPVKDFRRLIIFIASILLLLQLLLAVLISRRISNPVNEVQQNLESLAQGHIPEQALAVRSKDEIGMMTRSLNHLIDAFQRMAEFAKGIGQGNLEANFEASSEKDQLGQALIKMRDNLKQSDEENSYRSRRSQILNDFLKEIRGQASIQEGTDAALAFLIKEFEASLGSVFIQNKDSKNLQMKGVYALGRKKYLDKEVEPGQGLVGQVFLEAKAHFIKEIPKNYHAIESSLAEMKPEQLFLTPIKTNDKVIGVLELAFLKEISEQDRELIQELMESFASHLVMIQSSEETRRLLQASQEQSESMKAQEEELRQNMEELSATQEEMRRKEKAYQDRIAELEAKNKE